MLYLQYFVNNLSLGSTLVSFLFFSFFFFEVKLLSKNIRKNIDSSKNSSYPNHTTKFVLFKLALGDIFLIKLELRDFFLMKQKS